MLHYILAQVSILNFKHPPTLNLFFLVRSIILVLCCYAFPVYYQGVRVLQWFATFHALWILLHTPTWQCPACIRPWPDSCDHSGDYVSPVSWSVSCVVSTTFVFSPLCFFFNDFFRDLTGSAMLLCGYTLEHPSTIHQASFDGWNMTINHDIQDL